MPLEFTGLSADAAHRFRAVAEVLQARSEEFEGKPSLLDVGGYPGVFAREFSAAFPRWQATTLDTPSDDLPNYIAGSGDKMEFGDQSFDAVSTIDTLEHIPPGKRAAFIRELCRVSRNLVVVAAPFHHPATAAVEKHLNETHDEIFGAPHPWLHEHVDNGLPKLRQVMIDWPSTLPIVDIKKSYDLQAWATWQAMSMYRKLRGETDKIWAAFDAASAGATTPRITDIPYRYIIVAQRDGTPIEKSRITEPAPELGTEAIELTRLYCRMIQLSVGVAGAEKGDVPGRLIDQRLKEALAASEGEVRRLQKALDAKASSGGPPSPANSSSTGIRRFFTRERP